VLLFKYAIATVIFISRWRLVIHWSFISRCRCFWTPLSNRSWLSDSVFCDQYFVFL